MANSLLQKLILLVAIFALVVVACNGDDDEPSSNADTEPNGEAVTFPNPAVMADIPTAAGLRENPSVRFVDLRSAEDYATYHIIEAVNADPTTFGYGTDALPERGPLEATMRGLGVTEEMTVILYDSGVSDAATWVFWVLDTYGHDDVRILNGGIRAWYADGRSVVLDVPQITPSNYSLPEPDNNRFADADWVNSHRTDGGVVVLDARVPEEFQGIEGGGHIEGAINIFGELAYANEAVRDPMELRDIFDDDALLSASTVVVYNMDGLRGSKTYYALRLMGINVRLYVGGMDDWLGRGLSVVAGVE